LGNLDENYFSFCRWWGAYDADNALESIVMLYTGLRLPAVLTFGDPTGVEDVLDDADVRDALPAQFYAHVMNGHLAALQHRYDIGQLRSMVRMGLSRNAFVNPGDNLSAVEAIGHAHTASLISLYQFYPDNFFEPYQLESGFYFGLSDSNDLVSVAGTHIFSEKYDIAAIGNIVTHPEHRAKGYSRRCTTRLLEALFAKVSTAALNVERDNEVAHRIYRRLGFVDHVRYLEGTIRQKS